MYERRAADWEMVQIRLRDGRPVEGVYAQHSGAWRVVSGTPSLRTPEGERELAPGEVVAFLSGRRGAHQILNRSGAPARVLMISTNLYPEVVEHPDSNKVLAITGRPDETAALFLAFRKDDAVPVTEGEER